jgi:5-methylcytosine-specific restriction endonuclease McrA
MITTEYRQYLKGAAWNKRRRKTLKLAGYRCQRCGEAKPLQAHHLTYENIFNETPGIDLMALCFDCHKWVDAGWLKRVWLWIRKRLIG